MATDRLGLPLTTNDEAARAYVDGVDRMLASWPGAHEQLSKAVELDSQFALGHGALARFAAMHGNTAQAQAAATLAATLASQATSREQQHVNCINLLVHGKAAQSLRAVEEHLQQFPADTLVLSLALGAFGLIAFSGRADHDTIRLRLCEQLAPQQPGDDWWFLSYFGWAYTEAGELAKGQDITRRGFELRRENAHGAHSLAHSYHECGQHADAIAHLDEWLPSYDAGGQLFCHLNWHRALLDVQAGDIDAAIARACSVMAPGVTTSPPINVLTDGASLLWRIMLYAQGPHTQKTTHAIEQHWQLLADYANSTWPAPMVSFIDVHCAMADAATGDNQKASARAQALQDIDDQGKLAAGTLPSALATAIGAYARGDYAGAADTIESVLAQLPRLGGSHAQREVHEETLIAACLQCERQPRAAQLLNERLARRPSKVDQQWLSMASH